MNKKYRKDISRAEFERIERFLLGKMNEDELKQFKADLKRDEYLRDEVNLQAKLLATVESGSMSANASIQTAKMQESREPLSGPEVARGKRPVSRYRWHAVAAALVAVVVSVWYFGLRPSHEEQLFEAYFVPPKGLITPMSATDNYLFYDAMVDYKQGDYPQAITKWRDLLEVQPKNDTLVFFIGAAYLAHGDAVKSTPYLEQSVSYTESVFNDEAWFYLGMAQLKLGDTEQAKAALKKSRMERSKALLHRLNEE